MTTTKGSRHRVKRTQHMENTPTDDTHASTPRAAVTHPAIAAGVATTDAEVVELETAVDDLIARGFAPAKPRDEIMGDVIAACTASGVQNDESLALFAARVKPFVDASNRAAAAERRLKWALVACAVCLAVGVAVGVML